MSQLSADREEGLDRKQLNLIRKRFLQVNRERLERLRSAAREREADIVDLLPMLWHVNHPVLPGWIDYDTPHSISDYTPAQATLIAAKKVAKAFEYERKAALRRDIYALFLMGSTGSLGHSGQSDLDVWLIHHPDLPSESVAALAEKAKRISHYAQQNDVALHVYLLTEEAVRHGQFGQMSQEHSGSTQHMLLLDEFYRSAILIAGRLPLWWLVPPEAHHQYEQYADRLITQRFVRAGEYVDFGNVTDIPIHEFFSGSLWQLNKSLDAPYKSVLKLSLMEAYAHTPAPPPLSLTFKERIYHSRTNVVDLDAYLLIYRCVEQHLLRQGDTLRLEIIRRALYLKTGIKLSQTPIGEDWQRELLHNLVREWGWPRTTLLALDNRRHWKIETVIFERQQLSEVLNHSAKALQGFARSNADIASQNQQELTLLNRKLFATLEKRAGKIERLNLNIAPDVSESALTIIVERDIGCSLARGLHDPLHAHEQASLKRSHTLTELLAWAHANGLLMRRTRLALVSDNPALSLAESATIARDIIDSFPTPLPLATNQALQSNATLVQMAVFINVGFDPMADLSRQGLQLVSDRTDALCYGSSHELLVQRIEVVWLNSWGELLTANYGGLEAIPQLLLKLHALTEYNIEPARVQCFCASPTRGPSIAARTQQLLHYFVHDILPMAKHSPLRFLLRLGRAFAEVQLEEQARQMRLAENLPTLMSWLAEPLPPACELIFEQEMSADFDFDMIYLQRRQGSIQLFFRRVLDRIDVFVLDEADALVLCQYIATETKHLLSAWRSFLSNVSDRQRSLLGLPSHPSIECFEILPQGKLNHERIRRVESLPSIIERHPISVVASTRANQPVSNELVIIVNQQEFSALENGSAYLRLAAEHILSLRNHQSVYPIYLTDLMLTDAPEHVSTAYFLRHKRQLEEAINATLTR